MIKRKRSVKLRHEGGVGTGSDRLPKMAVFRSSRKSIILLFLVLMVVCSLYYFQGPCFAAPPEAVMVGPAKYVMGSDSKKYMYNNDMPLIFIGGMPRSGTTLLRVLLDAHPDIRCGEETRVIPRILGIKQQWTKSNIESKRLQAAGITTDVLDAAVSSFILEVIARHGEPAPRLCNKDPFTLRSAVYLHSIFPNAKYIFMIRDGRAVVHSVIIRKVTISGFDLTDYRQCMQKWNAAMQAMYNQCRQLGLEYCLPVYYEQLVLHPKPWMEKILKFLDVPWNDSVMHHDQFVNKPGGISLSKLERSTDQVIKPINLEALSKWVGHIPEEVIKDMPTIAPMLSVLGYNPYANPPNYGKPDSFVIRNTKEIEDQRTIWENKEKKLQEEMEAIKRSAFRRKEPDVGPNSVVDTPGKTNDKGR